MAKVSITYVCSNCGAHAPQLLGKCPVCGEWGTYEEEKTEKASAKKPTYGGTSSSKPVNIREVTMEEDVRIDMRCGELNRVLGGGLVPGSLVLLGGEPGIGKSTLALQVLMQMENMKTLYASGEESVRQIKLRAERLKGTPKDLYLLSDTSLESILEHINQIQPQIVVIDSIQTIRTETLDSTFGSLSQIRECTAKILQFAKENNITEDFGAYRGHGVAV